MAGNTVFRTGLNDEGTLSEQFQANTHSPPLTVGVFGHYGNENLGDEAIIEAVIQAVRDRFPAAQIYGFSINPADTAQRYGIPAFPIRYYAERSTTPPASIVAGGVGAPTGLQARSHLDAAKNLVKAIPLLAPIIAFVGQCTGSAVA